MKYLNLAAIALAATFCRTYRLGRRTCRMERRYRAKLAIAQSPVRIVNLWATWCGPCRKEMPAMSKWYKAQKKGSVDMVGIALDTSDNIGNFLKQTPVSYPIRRYTGANSRT